jgi:eukaryotic-like serine/threonine-protein kinase
VSSIGPYRIARELGTGGMGTVLLAHDRAGRPVAVKVLHAHLRDDAVFRQRFAQEVAAARRVAGFCTARVLDADLNGRTPYLVTEYVDGLSLHDRVSRYGPLPPADAQSLAVGVAAALTAIHAAGVVHRDLKPSNVMLSSSGAKVIDFGIAGPPTAPAGVRFGTPGWLAPEQAAGHPGGPAADVYAWGLLVAWAATGRHPYEGRRGPDLAGLPPRLVPHVRACLAPDPARRPGATELLLRLCGQPAGALTQPLGPPVALPAAATRPLNRAPARPVLRPATRPLTRPLPGARAPRPRPARPRRRPWRLPALGLGAMLLGIWLVGGQHRPGRATEAAVPPAASRPAVPAPASPTTRTADGVRDGGFRFAVTGVRCGAGTLGSVPTRKRAKGQFCLVDLRVTNEGKRAGFLFVGSQRLEDTAGTGYTADQWAWVYYDRSRAFTATLDKGATVDGTLVYDVPAGITPARLVVHDTPLSDGAAITLR